MENRATRSLGTLPVELLRSTLKHLDGDKRSLQACSLVCHFLHPLSYELLFNSARITHSKGCKGDRSLTSFSVFLPTAPLAASCLRSLHLLPGSMIRPEASLDLGCLYRCLNLLPNLRRLQLSSAPIRSSQPDNYGHSFARLSRPFLDLIVHNPRTTFPHNPDPLAVLDIFATLGSLAISQVLQPFGMDEIPPEHRVVAKSLKITHTQAPVAAKCLRLLHAKLMPSSVESFELLAVDTSALTALDQPVRESGGGMRSCTLNLVPLTIFSTDGKCSIRPSLSRLSAHGVLFQPKYPVTCACQVSLVAICCGPSTSTYLSRSPFSSATARASSFNSASSVSLRTRPRCASSPWSSAWSRPESRAIRSCEQ